MNKYKKVMLIYGGISSEREISIISSKGINDSLIRNNYEVVKIDNNFPTYIVNNSDKFNNFIV